MKWIYGVGVAIVAVSPIVLAQSGGRMDKPAMSESMDKNETYVGCVEAGNVPGSFVLTHVAHESAADGAMKADSMMKHGEAMTRDTETMDHMSASMAPGSVMLTGASVSKKHVGRKVSVTGSVAANQSEAMSQGTSTLSVKSVKVLAKSCS